MATAGNKSLKAWLFVFVAVALVSAVLALRYSLQRDEIRAQMKRIDDTLKSSGTASEPGTAPEARKGSPAGSDKVFKLLALVEQKDAAIRQLQLQIEELTGRRPARSPVTRPPASTPPVVPQPQQQANPKARLDPTRLAASFRQQAEFFSTLDISDLGATEQKTHADLQQKLADIQEQLAELDANSDRTDASKARELLLAEIGKLIGLLTQERKAIYYAIGRSLGQDETAAYQFADYLTYINQMTATQSLEAMRQSAGSSQAR